MMCSKLNQTHDFVQEQELPEKEVEEENKAVHTEEKDNSSIF